MPGTLYSQLLSVQEHNKLFTFVLHFCNSSMLSHATSLYVYTYMHVSISTYMYMYVHMAALAIQSMHMYTNVRTL